MTLLKLTEWKKLPISLAELCLDTTLRCGQSFRWKQLGNEGEWLCSMKGRVISLKQDSTHLHYRALWPATTCSTAKEGAQFHVIESDDTESLIKHYFNLKPQLSTLYEYVINPEQQCTEASLPVLYLSFSADTLLHSASGLRVMRISGRKLQHSQA